MSKMWRGPSQAVRDSASDPLSRGIVRRIARYGVFITFSDDGKSAEIYQLRQRGGDWVKHPLDPINGFDPVDTALRIAFEHTPFDGEFIAQRTEYLIRKSESLAQLVRMEMRLCDEIDGLISVLHV